MVEMINLPGKGRRNPRIYNGTYLVLKNLSDQIRTTVERIEKSDLKVLDIGCGNKPYYLFFKGKTDEYIGMDIFKSDPVDCIAVGEYLPFKSNCFDTIISTQVLYRVDDPIRFIGEIYRCLKKDGVVLLSTPCMWSTDGGRWYYTKHGLKLLFDKFSKVEIIPNCYSFGSLFLMINLYWIKLIKIPFYPMYLINNILGKFFDRLSKNDMFVVNYLVRGRK